MAVIDREALRGLMLMAARKMTADEAKADRIRPVGVDTGLSDDDEAVLDAMCYLGNGSAGEVCAVLMEWYRGEDRPFTAVGVGRILRRMAERGFVTPGWTRTRVRNYVLTEEGKRIATTPNPQVWKLDTYRVTDRREVSA